VKPVGAYQRQDPLPHWPRGSTPSTGHGLVKALAWWNTGRALRRADPRQRGQSGLSPRPRGPRDLGLLLAIDQRGREVSKFLYRRGSGFITSLRAVASEKPYRFGV